MSIPSVSFQTFPNVFVDEFGRYIFSNYRRNEVRFHCLQTLPKEVVEKGEGKDWYMPVMFRKVDQVLL